MDDHGISLQMDASQIHFTFSVVASVLIPLSRLQHARHEVHCRAI